MSISNQIPSSRVIQPGVCTSSTRPASPYTGQCIYETDTNRLYVWNGSAWVIPNQTTQNPEGLELVRTVTVSGSSLVTMDSLFTTTYDNYRIHVNVYGSAASYGKWRFRASGTPATTGYYYGGFYSSVNGLNNYAGSGVSDLNGVYWGSSSSIVSSDYVEVFNPASVTYTGFKSTLWDYGGTPYAYNLQGHREPAVSYDGIQMTPASGTVTGTIAVYGMRKS